MWSVSDPESGLSLVLGAKGKEGNECGFKTMKLLMKLGFLKNEVCRLVSFDTALSNLFALSVQVTFWVVHQV